MLGNIETHIKVSIVVATLVALFAIAIYAANPGGCNSLCKTANAKWGTIR